ncbi:cysteine-tryptophan domain-containing zinc finger protein 7-like [Juglans microcarpa x Juglans regia]|uniref:cysteine-tryptophan domain-containing zinc finger protein 7-like n=1 Tax=Juglans microcarpa x Juglans regia TaxID=2249226 RepID=UPI001B7EBC2E|nr:cysteine-tryptophan domain-containing zinc finger protein 7-like [Juglans microcarpa x Juglans regia]
MVDMEGNPKLEGGEARYFKGDEDKNIDPDIALSYIDEKIQNVLGHFQKDFEGGVSAEHLGAKFGGYGSFLPAYERSPSILSRPNSPQRNYNVSRSNNLPIEGASQNLKAPPNTAPPSRLGITSCSAHQLHKSRVLSMDVSLKQSQVNEMSPLKDETSNRPGNPTDQRPLKVRIKMGSDNSGRGNAAIYSGLGLDYSPSSSPGNSLEESEGVSPISQGTFDNSPASIIEEMTSFTIPGGVLISPLHDSLLCLMRKEKVYSISRPIPPLKGHQEHSAMLVDESRSIMGNGKVFKEKRTKSMKRDRLVKLKYGGTGLDDTTLEMKKISVNEIIEAKELLIGDLKCTHISKSVKEAGGVSELLRESNKDGGKSKLLASELVKEESSESISGQEHGKSQKQNPRSSLVENVCGNRVVNSHKDVLIDYKDVSSGQKISASKSYSDESKCKEEPNPQKNKIGWKATFREDDEVNLPFKTEELSFEGKKKSKGIQSNGKLVNFSVNESFRPGESAEPSNKRSTGYGGIVCNSKVQRKTSQKDYKGKDSCNDSLSLTNLKEKDNRMDPVERPGGDRKKDANLGAFELQRNVFLDKGKGRSSGKKIYKQSIYGPSIKDASTACPITENGLASEMVPPMAVPVVIEEDWVQCDRCQKWRLLPFGTKPDQLPDKWLCSMLNWLHGMNHCDISEEETTKALNALYQLPVPESQNNLQNHVTGTTLGVSLGDKQHLDENNQNLSSHAISNRGKKKPGFKEKANAGTIGGPFQVSNSTKNKLQESEKSRSLNDTNQHLAEANPTKKSSSQHLSVLHNLVAEKDMPSQRENPINGGGDVRQIKMKSKREADEYGCGTSKKSKTEDMHADKHKTLKMGRGRVGISSSSFLPTMGSGNVIQKYDGFLPEGRKCDVNDKVVASVKKLGDKVRVPSDGGSLEMRMSSKKDMSLKKRKLKDQEISKNKIETFPNSAPDGRVYEKEERSERGFRKEKKFRFSNTEVESRPNDATYKSNNKGRMSGIFLSDIRDHPVDGMEEARRNDKDQQLRKHKKKIVSERTTDVVSLRRDLGSGQVSMAANSSSSKVSGSSKTRANIEEVRGSPVESVSSSPLRTFNLDNLTSAGGDIAGKDDAMNSVRPVMGDFRRCSDGERNAEINLPETVICLEPLKFSALECMDGGANHQLSGKANPSPDTRNSHLPNGDVDMVEQNVRFLGDLRAPEHSWDEDRGKKNCHDKAVLQKADKGTGLRSRGKSRSSISEFDGDKIKISDPVNEYTKKSQRIDLEIDSNHRVPVHETTADVKHSFPKKTSIKFRKDEKNHACKGDPVGQWSSASRMVTKLKEKEPDGLDMKPGAQFRSNGKLAPQHGLIQDFEGENKADSTQMEQRVGKSKFSLSFGEGKLEKVSLGCAPVPGPQKLNGAIHAPGDVSKTSKDSGKVDIANQVNLSLGNLQPDRQGVRDLKASSPGRLISSSQTATNTLKEAKDLRDTADRLKSSCFGFESNEAYFQAGLKFLHGALLLDNCNGEGGRNEEMNPIQAYGTAAKLCELCALQYEARQEMAAAALAYKCSEVAYMKVVYCKHSSLNRDRHELQATLHVVPQGESPSSSASDVDNLNNLATVDKGNLSKGTGSYVAGNQIIVARNRPQFVRLLDFTQDVVFALEASRKSQEAFAAANVILEEEQNRDCVTSVKRVIDFSFEDVEELVRLVRIAMEAISCSGFGAARD